MKLILTIKHCYFEAVLQVLLGVVKSFIGYLSVLFKTLVTSKCIYYLYLFFNTVGSFWDNASNLVWSENWM